MEEWDDLYRILEVAPDADAESIDAAYWRLSLRYSTGEEAPEDAQTTAQIARAYEILSDPQQRADYDRMRKRHRGGLSRWPRFRRPRLPAGTLASVGRALASGPRAVPRLLKRLRVPRPSRRAVLIAGFAAVVAAGLVVGFVYPPDFGGDGPGVSSLGGPGVPVAAVGPTPVSTPTSTPERTSSPTSTPEPTDTPIAPRKAPLDTDSALGDILEALGQIEGRLQLVESRLGSSSNASAGGASIDSPPMPTVTPIPIPAPAPTPTPAPTSTPMPTSVDPGQLDWIERHRHENGELPLIPGWLAPLVDNAVEGDTVEGQTVLIPTAEQWCHILRPSDRLKLLDYVTWLGYHYEDWVWQVGRAIGDDWLSRCPPASSY